MVADASTADAPLERVLVLWREIADLGSISELLQWDQETVMPARGLAGRSDVLGTIAGLVHRRLTDPALADALDALAAAEPTGDAAAQLRVARHHVRRAQGVPETLTRALAEAKSRGTAAWQAAREADDFTLFAPALERLIDLRRQQAAAIGASGCAGDGYDALLDGYEPGATEASLEPLFTRLRGELGPWLRDLRAHAEPIDESPARGRFSRAGQLAFGRRMLEAIGFDFEAGRIDDSTHPFCVGANSGDVRMTWRSDENDFRPGLYGLLHEAGHGLYEQGLPTDLRRTPVGDAPSLGLHESQSRLWENHVGRSKGFWRFALPHFQAIFPAAHGVSLAQLWPTLHTAVPSLIRVDADEATYNLHVAIRFELERLLIRGDLSVPDLPSAWDDAYEEALGIRAPSALTGVLQDIHWSQGMFGYFPTYTLGTMASAQLFVAAEAELGPLEPAFAEGRFAPLLDWLRRNVHTCGSLYTASEIVERACGGPLSADALLDYLRRTTEEAYGTGST